MKNTQSISKEKRSQIVFSKEAITLKAIRQIISIYQDRFDFEVNENSDNYIINISNIDSLVSLKKIKNEFNDQQIRIDLQEDFGKLRDLIVKYAFFPAESDLKND